MEFITDKDKIKILVTGANGFIGSNLCRDLINEKFFVRALALTNTPVENISGIVNEIVFADITHPDSLQKPLLGITHVFHLAALASDWGSLDLHLKVNTQGTKNLLEESVKNGVSRFLYVSSLAVHELSGHDGSDENTPAESNINAYAVSKRKSEILVKGYFESNKLETVIIRPGFFPYGPGDTTSFIHLAKAISSGNYANINGGKSKISTSYIHNLTRGMILAAFHPKSSGQTFILCDDEPVSWKQISCDISASLNSKKRIYDISYKTALFAAALVEFIWTLLKIKTPPPITKYRIAVPRKNLIFSNNKAKSILGFKPDIRWKEGLEKTINWYCDYLST